MTTQEDQQIELERLRGFNNEFMDLLKKYDLKSFGFISDQEHEDPNKVYIISYTALGIIEDNLIFVTEGCEKCQANEVRNVNT